VLKCSRQTTPSLHVVLQPVNGCPQRISWDQPNQGDLIDLMVWIWCLQITGWGAERTIHTVTQNGHHHGVTYPNPKYDTSAAPARIDWIHHVIVQWTTLIDDSTGFLTSNLRTQSQTKDSLVRLEYLRKSCTTLAPAS